MTTNEAIDALEDAVKSGQGLSRRQRDLLAKLTRNPEDRPNKQKPKADKPNAEAESEPQKKEESEVIENKDVVPELVMTDDE